MPKSSRISRGKLQRRAMYSFLSLRRHNIPQAGGDSYCERRELSVQTHIFWRCAKGLIFVDGGAIRTPVQRRTKGQHRALLVESIRIPPSPQDRHKSPHRVPTWAALRFCGVLPCAIVEALYCLLRRRFCVELHGGANIALLLVVIGFVAHGDLFLHKLLEPFAVDVYPGRRGRRGVPDDLGH